MIIQFVINCKLFKEDFKTAFKNQALPLRSATATFKVNGRVFYCSPKLY